MKDNINPLVSIECWTYNHQSYILQCIDGFVMQKTKFPFVVFVVDDASTDNEQNVLWNFIYEELDTSSLEKFETEDYVKVIATHKINFNCTFVFFFLKYNHYSIKKDKKIYLKNLENKTKYIAICEGDDYWKDPLKLKKQVDYLENHPECGLVYTDYQTYNQKTGNYSVGNCIQTHFEDLLLGNKIATLTTCFRKELLDKYNQEIVPHNKGWMMGDLPLWLYLSANSQIKLLPIVTATYRVLENSASHSLSVKKRVKFLMSGYNIDVFFAKKYGREHLLKDIAKARIGHLINDSYRYDQNLPFCFTKFFIQNNIFDVKLYIRSLTTHSRILRKLMCHLLENYK